MLFPFFGQQLDAHASTATFTIAANTAEWNLLDQLAIQEGIETVIIPMTITITINAAVEVYSTTTSKPAMDLSGMPGGTTIDLTNNGYILGRGGNGGEGYDDNFGGWGFYMNGGAGGNAIVGPGSGSTLNITNASGNVWGGGGGGGGGDLSFVNVRPYEPEVAPGSGGGGGAGGSLGGEAGSSILGSAQDGAAGTGGAAGAGGAGGTAFLNGGDGGAYGAAGQNGSDGGYNPGDGGAAGYYVRSLGGTVNWISGGSAPNVKGSAD